MPEISVVIPLYNKECHIERALKSVLNQTIRDFEVIVVDDGSTDGGAEVVRSVDDPRIQLVRQENLGVSAARNCGIGAAKADLIAFLDADDEWLPEHFEILLRLRGKYPEAGAYGTAYFIKKRGLSAQIASFSNEIPRKPWEGLIPGYFKAASFGDPPISASTVGIPKHILTEMGGFTTEAWWGEDTDLWGRIALKYPVAFSWDGAGVYYTEAMNRACKRVEPVEENIFVQTARDAIGEGKVPHGIRDDLLEYVALKLIDTAWRNIEAGRQDLAKNNLKTCLTSKFRRKKYWALIWAYMPYGIYCLMSGVKSSFINILNSRFWG